MAKPESILPEKESAILILIYENPDMAYDTYGLTNLLKPQISPQVPEYPKAFKETLSAIEQLVVRGLVDGKQLKGNLGMYYSRLTIKYKGKQVAIQERKRKEELERILPEMIKEANAVAEEIRKAQEKK